MGGSKGSNGNSNSQAANPNASGAKSSDVAAAAAAAASGGGAHAAGSMKAPGRDDTISRESFESNPAAYFKDLRK
ncbi:hypothetical protein GBA52_024284 [Prunus armeniaca]|nr:hypothetical protein GBA52_024284 [Prunus armeniaca]